MKTAEPKTVSPSIQRKESGSFFRRNNNSFFGHDGQPAFFKGSGKNSHFVNGSRVQTKLTIGQPDDKYEQEADAMADKVVQRLAATGIASKNEEGIQAKPLVSSITPVVQRKCAHCEEEEKLQKKDDEASLDDMKLQRKPIFESNAEPPEDDGNIQRKCAHCEEEEKLQKKSAPGESASASPDIESSLSSSKGSGQSLPDSTRASMENSFGTDFSGVRVHTDSSAVDMSRNLNAQAFTHGSDIYFNAGNYDTSSTSGQHLLAHELTHTVQQGGTDVIQRRKKAAKRSKKTTPPTPGYYEGEEGKIDIRENTKMFLVASMDVPDVKHIFTFDYKNLPHKPDERDNSQRDIWIKEASAHKANIAKKVNEKADAEKSPKDIVDKANNRIYFFKLKSSPTDYVIGTIDEVVNSVIIPSWNLKGGWADKHVDHKLEIQLGGPNVIENMWLLEASANMSCGGLINSELNRKIDALVKAGNESANLWAGKQVPTATEIRKNHFITVQQYSPSKKKVKGDEEDRFILEEITQKAKPLDGLRAMSKSEVKTIKSEGKHSPLRIFFRRSEEQARGWFFNVRDWKEGETERKTAPFPKTIKNIVFHKLTYNPKGNSDEPVGKLEGIAFKYDDDDIKLVSKKPVKLDLKETPATDFGGYVTNSDFREAVKDIDFIPGSPVRIDDISFDDKQGLVVKGKLLPTIPFMEKADIDIIIDGNGVRLRKVFTSDEIKLPGPFEVSNTSLEISVGSKGLSVAGEINFAINNVGEGCLSGSVDQKGNIKLSGNFNIASDLFEESSICFTYERTSEGESRYVIGGHIRVGEGKVKGLKSAEADVLYGDGKLSAKAQAEPDIKGVGVIEMFLNIEKDKYSFGGKVPLVGLVPRVKEGELEIEVTKSTEGVSIAGKGTIVPDIPGIENDPRIQISYKDGGILIQGDLPFKLEKAKAEGSISLGFTNLVVDENNKISDQIADHWTVFGNGKVTIMLAKNIAAEASVTLQPNGDIIVSGKVGLDRSKQKDGDAKPPFEHTLFKITPPPIILFAIPPIGASLTLKIEGGARLYASFVPPHIKELSLELIGLNLTNPDDNAEILGKISIGMSGKGGVEMYLTLTATLSILVAKVAGSLTGSIGLEANADADASVTIRWSKAKGLTLEQGELSVKASAQFLAKLKGAIRVYLDLWIAEIDIWEEELEIASVKFGEAFNVGFKVPLAMDDGELKTGELNKDSFEVPDLTSESEQQKIVKQAASEDEKVKPPPPPSKEEAINAVNKLKAGPIEFWDVITMDANEARARVTLGWVNRDTYLMWLKTKHSRLDWSEVVEVSRRRDDLDYEDAKNELRNMKGAEFMKLIKVGKFAEAHHFFSRANEDKIDFLVELVKNPGKVEQAGAETAPAPPAIIPTGQSVPANGSNAPGMAGSPNESPTPTANPQVMAKVDDSSGNRSFHAQAFSNGQDKYFKQGENNTNNKDGKHLPAHELRHDKLQPDHTIRRKAEITPTGTYTGNYIFDPGNDGLNSSFFYTVKRNVSDGPLDDAEITALRTNAIARNGTIMHGELLLMAAMRNPVNVTLMQAHKTGPLIISMSNINQVDKDYITNFGRESLPEDIVNLNLRLLAAALGLSGEKFEDVEQELSIQAQKKILEHAGKQFADQANKLIVSAEYSNPKVPLTAVLTAMLNGASDSTPGDKVMAGLIYDVAKKANHPMAEKILSGTLKVDAMIPSVYRRIAGSGDASYTYSTDQDVRKSDTLYVPTSLDIFLLDDRALIIHELTHASDDFAVSSRQQVDSLTLEAHAYKEQAKYLMDQVLSLPSANRSGYIGTASAYTNQGPLFYWSMVAAAKEDVTKYEQVLIDINTAPPKSMSESSVKTDLALAASILNTRVRTELLAYRDSSGNQLYTAGTTNVEGASGHYFNP